MNRMSAYHNTAEFLLDSLPDSLLYGTLRSDSMVILSIKLESLTLIYLFSKDELM